MYKILIFAFSVTFKITSFRVYIHISKKRKNLNMPQLIPFFFLNQVVFNFILLTLIVYVLSKYILPKTMRLFKTRMHINQL